MSYREVKFILILEKIVLKGTLMFLLNLSISYLQVPLKPSNSHHFTNITDPSYASGNSS